MSGVCCSVLVDAFPELRVFLTIGHLCSFSTTRMIFCVIIICFGICPLNSHMLRGPGGRQFLLSLSHTPVDAATSGKGIPRAGVLGSEDPNWVLLPGFSPSTCLDMGGDSLTLCFC